METKQELLTKLLDAAKCLYDDKNQYIPKPNYSDNYDKTTDKPVIPPNLPK